MFPLLWVHINQTEATNMNNLELNQIVKGRVGYFLVVGFRSIDGESYAQVKSVNPRDFTQVARGELALPTATLQSI
jgi:hypothetical protein